jgi:alkylation response protein AidB-like acyl-CoA dehydrogenase
MGLRSTGSDRRQRGAPLDGLHSDTEATRFAARAEKLGRLFADQAREWGESDDAPYREIFDRVGAEGVFGIAMPTEYGVQGGGAGEYLIVVEALFRYAQSWVAPEPVFCTRGPGPSPLLLGSDTVQKKYLHDIAAGRRACNIALTEPHAGSAVTHLSTTAVRYVP